MTDDAIHRIPLDEICTDALIRDRTALDAEALMELRSSIAVNGLRMPIEVYAFEEARGPLKYGLISGSRRLAAFRALLDVSGNANMPPFRRSCVRRPVLARR